MHEGTPLLPPVSVTPFTPADADALLQANDNISLRNRKTLLGVDCGMPWTYVRGAARDQKADLALAAGDRVPSIMHVHIVEPTLVLKAALQQAASRAAMLTWADAPAHRPGIRPPPPEPHLHAAPHAELQSTGQ